MFALPFGLMNLSRADDADAQLVSPYLHNAYADGIMNQYMLLLGEFNNLTAASGESAFETWLVMSMFLLATLFTQVAMLNMLIAVMLDSFDRTMEGRKRFDLENRIHLIRQLAPIMPMQQIQKQEEVYMICVERVDEQVNDDWAGNIRKITSSALNSVASLQNNINRQF